MEKIRSFAVLSNARSSRPTTAGDIVYKCTRGDYGAAAQDSRMSGIRYISVTFERDGNYPFFTIARDDIQEIIT